MPNFTKKHTKLTICTILTLMICNFSYGVNGHVAEHTPARNMVWNEKIERHIKFLSDSICQGRATGTRGNTEAAFHIIRQFSKAGLMPFDSSYARHFYAGKGLVGHNIAGMIPGAKKYPREKYIIIGAHYDHLGILSGNLYPGADANASGVVALTCIADMFSAMKTLGRSYNCSIIFVAFDGKEMNMTGSESLWRSIENGDLTDPLSGKTITPDQITLMVNLDQLGTTLAPLDKNRKDYLIMLGEHSLPQHRKGILNICNRLYSINFNIGLDYYGSEAFTKIFYGLSDQKVFAEHNIPAVMFTSGITMNTNRTRDTAETIDSEILKQRIWLIYHWITKMM